MVYTIKNNTNFDKQLKEAGNKLVVVDFYATWCGPCKSIVPKLSALSKKYKNKAVVLKVNVDKFKDIAKAYKVSSMPTFVFIKKELKISRFTGADAEKLQKRMAKYTKNA